jgi:hypothetical protein
MSLFLVGNYTMCLIFYLGCSILYKMAISFQCLELIRAAQSDNSPSAGGYRPDLILPMSKCLQALFV